MFMTHTKYETYIIRRKFFQTQRLNYRPFLPRIYFVHVKMTLFTLLILQEINRPNDHFLVRGLVIYIKSRRPPELLHATASQIRDSEPPVNGPHQSEECRWCSTSYTRGLDVIQGRSQHLKTESLLVTIERWSTSQALSHNNPD